MNHSLMSLNTCPISKFPQPFPNSFSSLSATFHLNWAVSSERNGMCPLCFPLPSTQLMASPQYLFVKRKNNLYAQLPSAEKGLQPAPIPAQLPPTHTHTHTRADKPGNL